MSQFAHLFAGLMSWSFDGYWRLTSPMATPEWERFYVHFDSTDDIALRFGRKRVGDFDYFPDDDVQARGPPVENKGFSRAMELGRARLGM